MEKIRFGKRIRELRKKKGLTLVELSKLTGVQVATLSRIESDKMTGTVETHHKIAYFLGIEIEMIGELYKSIKSEQKETEVCRTEKQSFLGDKYQIQYLTKKPSENKLFPYIITINPQGRADTDSYPANSEMFVYILEGDLEVIVGEEKHKVDKSRSLYFNASNEFYFRNTGKTKAKVLCVGSRVKL